MVWRRWPEQVPPTTRGQIVGIALFVGVALHVIVGSLGDGPQFQYFYLLFIPLIWATISFSLHGATAVLAAIQISLVALVMIRHVDVSILLSFQLLLFLMAVTGLFLGVSVHERLYTQATLRKRESELNQAISRAAAGELASTLAHELNQPLTALSAYSLVGQQLLQQPETSLEKLADLLAKMRAESQRAGQVVHRLRRFFRNGELHCENLKLSELIQQAWEPLIRRADKLHIDFVSSASDALPQVYADRVQIEIVLYNLLRNAVDAIASLDESSSARVISISARHEDQHVRIIVTDTGCGIPEAQHAHLFDAFNTSKVDGLGLGLNICRTLVESHRGQLWLASSRPGHTRFCFTLPVVEEEPRLS
jgi:C4-dicarboxylate-specific signal transduction histidine kinase